MAKVRPLVGKGRTQSSEDPKLRNWENARTFLELARHGSFRSASESMGISVNTLRRQMGHFEDEVGVKLFTRNAYGVSLTSEGEHLLAAAERMELASFGIVRARALDLALQGEVRLNVTEDLGTFWVAPRIVEFHRAHPGLQIELNSSIHPAEIVRLESDVGIQLLAPKPSELRVTRLGRLHLMPFAAPDYLAQRGTPKDIRDLAEHRFVLQKTNDFNSLAQLGQGVSGFLRSGKISFRTNASSAHYWAILCGAGIGFLPTYAQALTRVLEPVDLGVISSHDVWLVYHPDLANIPRVRFLVDWLMEAFSPRRYPWFGDDFIHPKDLPSEVRGLSLLTLQEGG